MPALFLRGGAVTERREAARKRCRRTIILGTFALFSHQFQMRGIGWFQEICKANVCKP